MDNYHPRSSINYSQPAHASFTLYAPRIYPASMTRLHDVKTAIPGSTSLVYKMTVVFLDSSSEITAKGVSWMDLQFTANVSAVEECWVESKAVDQAYLLDGGCQTSGSHSVELHHLDQAATSDNLTVYVRMKITDSLVGYTSRVYCSDGMVQY